MIAYKFLPRRYAEAASKGRFQISLLSVFNKIEDAQIRDEYDGKSVGFSNTGFEISEQGDPALRERFERHGFGKVESGGRIIVLPGSESRYEISGPPAHILSLSTDRSCRKWLDGDDPKDAVVTITDVNILAATIARQTMPNS